MKHITPVAVFLVSLCAYVGPQAHGQFSNEHKQGLGAQMKANIPSASLPNLPPALEKVRKALDKYQDPVVAVRDGYWSTLGCVSFPHGGSPGHAPYLPGTMGIHFLNGQLIGQQLDPLRPQALLYEPVGDRLRLVGAEWFVPLASTKERPQLFGQSFWGPMEGHYPLQPVALHHFDLHVWLWKHNPNGLFSATNPDVKCPPGRSSFVMEAPKLVPLPKTTTKGR
ncbi:MAG: hypothetical protein ACT4OG_06345 [Alphaproteobacteria bacterium]